ncbi:site-specific tyrosine recombinase XerD [Lactococcus muris]|uniref:Site-specific tyrosine recombinase XerD n=2 Tax=Lactococcus muris TaxID=2941330 RepID=A0ABV4D7B7_9LACT|nr:site-specific tyrosine recombinase XerD [Lactococcus garvieae]
MNLVKTMILSNEIPNFLASKNFSENTKSNYLYDLRNFAEFFEKKSISRESLLLYRQSLKKLTVAAQRRKISSANQFLSYLYEKNLLKELHKIQQVSAKKKAVKQKAELKNLSAIYRPVTSPGHFLAFLILEFGLTFAEIQQLRWENFNWKFKILTVEKAGLKRVLPIRDKFALYTQRINNADELFVKSRQFLYLELRKYTDMTAKELREQYILKQVRAGKTVYELAEALGLSTTTTLEKYYK